MNDPGRSTPATAKRRFDVADLEGVEGYKLGTGLVVPRPIGWIGSCDADGVTNLAPYSFFNMVSGVPPTFVFSPGRSGRRDTLSNVRDVPEFTINIVTDEVVDAMNDTAASLEAGSSEFDAFDLTAAPASVVRPPLVGECKANIECRVLDIVEIGDPRHGNALVIGEALVFHVEEGLLDGTRVDQAKLRAVGRHVGNTYSRTHDLFDIIRPD